MKILKKGSHMAAFEQTHKSVFIGGMKPFRKVFDLFHVRRCQWYSCDSCREGCNQAIVSSCAIGNLNRHRDEIPLLLAPFLVRPFHLSSIAHMFLVASRR